MDYPPVKLFVLPDTPMIKPSSHGIVAKMSNKGFNPGLAQKKKTNDEVFVCSWQQLLVDVSKIK